MTTREWIVAGALVALLSLCAAVTLFVVAA
jgi:hypothetical protein